MTRWGDSELRSSLACARGAATRDAIVRVLPFDDCGCGAPTDQVLAASSLSYVAGATSTALETAPFRRKENSRV
jgi:hypothetical protein